MFIIGGYEIWCRQEQEGFEANKINTPITPEVLYAHATFYSMYELCSRWTDPILFPAALGCGERDDNRESC